MEKKENMGLVTFSICEGNPGAIQFVMDAYLKGVDLKGLGYAETGFRKMRDAGIRGEKLYMIWNDCCGRDTELALKVINEVDVDVILAHIDGIRGEPFPKELLLDGAEQ